jgi:DNA-binding MurR/RpiR family transcriptional regulator
VHSGLTSAAIQDSDTVAIGISTTGRTDETIEMLAEARRAGAFAVAITNDPISPLAELADRGIVTSIYEQFRQPDDLSAKHGQLLVLDLLYLLVAQENFDRSSAKLAASALAVSSHRRPRRTPPRAAVTAPGGLRDGTSADRSRAADREQADR